MDKRALKRTMRQMDEAHRAASKGLPANLDHDPEFVMIGLQLDAVSVAYAAIQDGEISARTMARRMGISQRRLGDIVNERSSITLLEIAGVSAALRRRAKIVFESGL